MDYEEAWNRAQKNTDITVCVWGALTPKAKKFYIDFALGMAGDKSAFLPNFPEYNDEGYEWAQLSDAESKAPINKPTVVLYNEEGQWKGSWEYRPVRTETEKAVADTLFVAGIANSERVNTYAKSFLASLKKSGYKIVKDEE